MELSVSATDFTLSDVVLFVNTEDDLYTVNPFTGQTTTFITRPDLASEYLAQASPSSNLGYFDIAMRSDGRLYAFARGFGDNNVQSTNSTFTQINPSDASTMDTRVRTFDVSTSIKTIRSTTRRGCTTFSRRKRIVEL